MPETTRALLGSLLAALFAPLLVAQGSLGDRVAFAVEAAFEQPVNFEVATESTVRVTVAANPFEIREVLLMPDATGSIWMDYGDGPTSKASRVTGALEQLGHAPCAAVVQWARDGDLWKFSLKLTADRDAITAINTSIDKDELKWAKRLRTNEVLKFPDLDETERIAGFVRLWSEAKYNFAFFDRLPGLDWDRVLVDYLPRVQRATTAPAYYRVLQECLALLQDGHTDVSGPSDQPTAVPSIALGEVEGRIVVTGLLAPATLTDEQRRREFEDAELRIGVELLAIDGEPVAKVLKERIHPFVCASTPQHRSLEACQQLLWGEVGSRVRLTIRSGDLAPRDVTLTRGYQRARAPTHVRAAGDVEDGIVYVPLDSFGSAAAAEAFERLLPTIRRSKGLILDVRRNSGGHTKHGSRVISWLTDVPLPGSHWRTREYRPAFRAWGEQERWHRGKHDDVQPKGDPWLGPVVVLVGPSTFSAAEDFSSC